MNKKKREKLNQALNMLSQAKSVIDDVCEAEQDCLDNYPENLQGSENYEKMEDAIDDMQNAYDKIDEAEDRIALVLDS